MCRAVARVVFVGSHDRYDVAMLVFVYEHMSSGTLVNRAGAPSLHSEGRAMLSAVLADLQDCPGVETVTLLARDQSTRGRVVHACGPAEVEERFRMLARTADRTLVIAPETGGILAARCTWVEKETGRLLGPSHSAVCLTGDKLALAMHLSRAGVRTPPTRAADGEVCCPFPYPVVVKPRDGAGSLVTSLVADEEAWHRRESHPAAETPGAGFVVQPFVPGRAASVSFLLGPGAAVTLPPAWQHLSADGRFHYEGGSLPLPPGMASRAQRLARRAVATVPGLLGFVGVDLVLGEDEDGRDDVVIEINPRLTTSYVGLRELACSNLAAAMLALAEGHAVPPLQWRTGPVHWRADGTVSSAPPGAV